MNVPMGLRKPVSIVQLIPPVVLFAGVCVAVVFACLHLAEPPPMIDVPAPQASQLPSSLLAFEALFGVGVALLLLALIWGMARYVTRDRSKDAMSEAATHRLYHPDSGPEVSR